MSKKESDFTDRETEEWSTPVKKGHLFSLPVFQDWLLVLEKKQEVKINHGVS